MRKLLITLLAILYLGTSSGATLHFQYCMGRLAKVALAHTKSQKCHRCGMANKSKASKKCCTDKHQQLKSETGVVYSNTQLATPAVAIIPLVPHFYVAPQMALSTVNYHPASNAPPLLPDIPVFLRNCTFRI